MGKHTGISESDGVYLVYRFRFKPFLPKDYSIQIQNIDVYIK